MSNAIAFTLNGQSVDAKVGDTILQTAQKHGLAIPHLCHTDRPDYRSDGNCRACLVEIEGERTLAPSCLRKVTPGMVVNTQNDRVLKTQRGIFELLLSDQPKRERSPDKNSTLWRWVDLLGVSPQDRYPATPGEKMAVDFSHPAMQVDLSACIHCNLCLRGCREVQVNNVIGMANRGASTKIVFDQNDAMANSSCVGCGECVQICPTGALMPRNWVRETSDEHFDAEVKEVDSVCPYCGVGCQLTYQIQDEKIVTIQGRNGPSNDARLCVKGRFGFDYIHHRQRLLTPLIRKADAPKHGNVDLYREDPYQYFRPASWQEALAKAVDGFKQIKARVGGQAVAGLGSAKCSNEEAYLFQKFIRTAFTTNNVDHCTRLCHASSVAALLECLGSGAVSAPFTAVDEADVIVLIGCNPSENHPVAATYFKQAAKTKTLINLDPRRTEMSRHAKYSLPFKPGTDIALINALLNVIVTENLYDAAFIAERTSGFDALRQHIMPFTPEAMAPICGIDAATLRTVARVYAQAKAAIIFWGMGVSQHAHGTDNARCLIALALITGQIGRPGTGLHPLRGQNNVQGASDAGLIPMVYPDYQPVNDPKNRQYFEQAWGVPLSNKPGLTVVEMLDAIDENTINGMYIMGENPAMSDPDLQHARNALASLEHLVVQDIFMTETAFHADVILPASAWPEKCGTVTNTNRQIQMGRQALSPPGEAWQDWQIIQALAQGLGCDFAYEHPQDIFAEMAEHMPSLANISWQRIDTESSVTYPCRSVDLPGEAIIFADKFLTADGLGKIIPASCVLPDEPVDENYPLVLITGRQLEHWHTGVMTRRAKVLDDLEPEAIASLSPMDLQRYCINPGQRLKVSTRRGTIELTARVDPAISEGVIFIAFCYTEAAANWLTNPVLDPVGKIPEFKYCAAKIEPVAA